MDQRTNFNNKIEEIRKSAGKNIKMFSDEKYKEYVESLKEIRSTDHRMIPTDYSLIKRFELLQVEKDGN